jgi:flagellar motor switch protein FliG
MEWIKAIIFLVLQLGAIMTQAQSTYSEETGTLESIYETKARSVLNTLLRPQEYTLIISAELEKDDAKLKAYREKLELEYLPGLPVPGDDSLKPATNSLHEMRGKVAVHLVLSPDVTADKEAVIKKILANKLHLDEGNGDSINISRALFPSDPKPDALPPTILPEFTWKTWSLILLLALLSLSGLIYYFTKRNQNKKDEAPSEANAPLDFSFHPFSPKLVKIPQQEDVTTNNQDLKNISLEDMEREKDFILSLASQYPRICSDIAVSMIDKNLENNLIVVFDYMGWELAKKLMTEMPPRAWARLGQKLRLKKEKESNQSIFESLTLLHKEFLAGVLERGALNDEKNPFSFLSKATASERLEILKNETATNFAVISFFMSPEELNENLQNFSPEMQSDVTTAMSRLQSLPDAVIKKLSQNLQTKLIHFRTEPTTAINGTAIAGRTLRAMSPEREYEIFRQMQDTSPEEANKISKMFLQFSDLPKFPKDAVALALGEVEIQDLVKALKDQSANFTESILKLLPPKRALMVQRDLESPALKPKGPEQWAARRMIVLKIESFFNSQGLSIKNIWDQIESENSNTQNYRRVG